MDEQNDFYGTNGPQPEEPHEDTAASAPEAGPQPVPPENTPSGAAPLSLIHISLPRTMSSLAWTSCPALTSGSPAWAARIFWVIVIAIKTHPFLQRIMRLTAENRAFTEA